MNIEMRPLSMQCSNPLDWGCNLSGSIWEASTAQIAGKGSPVPVAENQTMGTGGEESCQAKGHFLGGLKQVIGGL